MAVSGSWPLNQPCDYVPLCVVIHPVLPDRLTVPRILSTEGRKAAAAFLSNIALAFYERAIRSAAEKEEGREGGRGPFVEIIAHGEGRKEGTNRHRGTDQRTNVRAAGTLNSLALPLRCRPFLI